MTEYYQNHRHPKYVLKPWRNQLPNKPLTGIKNKPPLNSLLSLAPAAGITSAVLRHSPVQKTCIIKNGLDFAMFRGFCPVNIDKYCINKTKAPLCSQNKAGLPD